MKRILRGVRPYNELALKSCYYNQLVTGYSMFKAEPRIVIADYLPLYSFDEKSKDLTILSVNVMNEETMQLLTGVERKKHNCINNIQDFLRLHIDSREPIILPVDCFYLSYRVDTFEKQHSPHFILVYGYDLEEKNYYVVDHMFQNSAEYRKQKVPMRELYSAYKYFSESMEIEQDKPLTVLKKVGVPKGNFSEIYRQGIQNRREDIRKSGEMFKNYIDFLLKAIQNIQNSDDFFEKSITALGNIRWLKNVQKNIFERVFHDSEMNRVTDRILEDYIFLYGIALKLKMKGIYSAKEVSCFAIRAEEVLELETRLHRFMTEDICFKRF